MSILTKPNELSDCWWRLRFCDTENTQLPTCIRNWFLQRVKARELVVFGSTVDIKWERKKHEIGQKWLTVYLLIWLFVPMLYIDLVACVCVLV